MTCSARVGLTSPDALAEGAAMGRPAARISDCAITCAGARSATVETGADEKRDRRCRKARQDERDAARPEGAGKRVGLRREAGMGCCSRPETCTMSGLKVGRPLASKMLATARSFVASAPRP